MQTSGINFVFVNPVLLDFAVFPVFCVTSSFCDVLNSRYNLRQRMSSSRGFAMCPTWGRPKQGTTWVKPTTTSRKLSPSGALKNHGRRPRRLRRRRYVQRSVGGKGRKIHVQSSPCSGHHPRQKSTQTPKPVRHIFRPIR